MEYIRLSKAQPNYDANVRHCLYGLDADLIMLGLLSHDPHFCLLREEVVFGPKKGKSRG
jgi:5'-3' exoribonuclease 1